MLTVLKAEKGQSRSLGFVCISCATVLMSTLLTFILHSSCIARVRENVSILSCLLLIFGERLKNEPFFPRCNCHRDPVTRKMNATRDQSFEICRLCCL